MSISSEVTRITNAKAAIRTAIEGKGVTVPDGIKLDGMAALIEGIEAGGGGSSGTSIRTGTAITEKDTQAYTLPIKLAGKTANDWPEYIVVYALRTAMQESTNYLEVRIIEKTGIDGVKYLYNEYGSGYNFGVQKTYVLYAYPGKSINVYGNNVTLNPSGTAMKFQAGIEYKWIAIGGNFA